MGLHKVNDQTLVAVREDFGAPHSQPGIQLNQLSIQSIILEARISGCSNGTRWPEFGISMHSLCGEIFFSLVHAFLERVLLSAPLTIRDGTFSDLKSSQQL